MQTQMMTRVRVFLMSAALCGVAAMAQGQARVSTLKTDPTPNRLRVTAAKAVLRARCEESATARASLQRGDELDIVRKVDANWYEVRVARTANVAGGAVEGCVAASAVEPMAAPAGAASASSSSSARQRPAATMTKSGKPKWFGVSGFVDLGQGAFTAKDSFEAILDSSSGPFFGGGGQVQLPWNLFGRVDITRFQKDGERAFVSGTEVFKLGIPTTITVMPIEFTGGYRRPLVLGRGRPKQPPPRGGKPASSAAKAPGKGFTLVPYGGGGVGSVQYKETADFAQAGDDVNERFSSYHVLGGVEVPIWWRIGAAVEYQHRWVPDALGTSGVSKEFNETDLGGGTFRIRIMVSF